VTALESQLAEVQESLAEETRQKLAAQGKVRQAEEELTSLREQIEEEEDSKKTLETKVASLSAQVAFCFTDVMLSPSMNLMTKFLFLLSNRQQLSYDDCLGIRRKIIRTVLCCIVYSSCAQSEDMLI